MRRATPADEASFYCEGENMRSDLKCQKQCLDCQKLIAHLGGATDDELDEMDRRCGKD